MHLLVIRISLLLKLLDFNKNVMKKILSWNASINSGSRNTLPLQKLKRDCFYKSPSFATIHILSKFNLVYLIEKFSILCPSYVYSSEDSLPHNIAVPLKSVKQPRPILPPPRPLIYHRNIIRWKLRIMKRSSLHFSAFIYRG